MTGVRRQVELLEKNKPRQERAKRTYESILVAAAELLIEVGIERISTNIMAERAGITVPALYRYFPNKYSVLHALGANMMDKQNEVCVEWLEQCFELKDPKDILGRVGILLRMTYDVTREQLAGLEIIQSLRAVGPLQELRLTSNRLVAQQIAEITADVFSWQLDEELKIQSRLGVEVAYGVVELALEEESLSAEDVLQQGANMIELYWLNTIKQRSA
ncbi:MAG: helix-turn-helix domain-containing protein [Halioglobus sp.]